MINSRFDDIRPYHESEISDAMKRIAASPMFSTLSEYVFPDIEVSQIKEMVGNIDTTYDFQKNVMKVFNEQVIRRSIDDFVVEGMDNIDKNKSYLFVSNHRDIVLDSSLLQYALHINGFETTDITFGANLMCSQLVVDIGKSNKMFKVERASTSRDFVEKSHHLAEFIYEDIVRENRSVWIAQRNGRTKDGIDATDPGIIKMFCMGGEDDIQTLTDLSIVPVAVSYEWEPCDILKTAELYKSRSGKYIKKSGEDLNSILTGILQYKGRVHFTICSPIDPAKEPSLEGKVKNAFYREVARIMDRSINSAYKLMPTNYIAHDLRSGTRKYQDVFYTKCQREEFKRRKAALLESISEEGDINELRDIFLSIYANPVDHHIYIRE